MHRQGKTLQNQGRKEYFPNKVLPTIEFAGKIFYHCIYLAQIYKNDQHTIHSKPSYRFAQKH